MVKSHIHKKDTVVVLSGKDRGKQGEVLKVHAAAGDRPARVLVSKVNIQVSHVRPRPPEPGGIQRKESPLPISKVMLLCPKCHKAIRPKFDHLESGDRVRVCRKCGEVIL